MFDSWYSSNQNLSLLRTLGWKYLVGVNSKRVFMILNHKDSITKIRLSKLIIPDSGEILPFRKIGSHRCFVQTSKDGRLRYWCTDHINMSKTEWKELKRIAFGIENYHRALKQFCNVERCQARRFEIQYNYISLSIRAFLRLELNGLTQIQTKDEMIRKLDRRKIRKYRNQNLFPLRKCA